jgi:hypothetical protein
MRRELSQVRDPESYAYSLSQIEDGWLWNVYDEDGEVVAHGAHICRDGAQAMINRLLSTTFLGESIAA